MRVLRRSLAVACALVLIPGADVLAQFIDAKLDWRVTTTGKVRQVITNMGTFDKGRTRYPGLINAEFPAGSDEEHLYQGGIWIGAITPTGDTLVSMSEAHFTPHEFFPTNNKWDSIWTGSKGDTLHLPYWPNYECISDQDFVSRYSDYNVLNIDNHTPLHLDIVQSTYSWSSGQLAEFLLHKYYITAKKIPLKDVYVGFWMHSAIGTIAAADNFIDEYTHWYTDYKMAVAEDSPGGSDGAAFSPIGFSVMTPTEAPSWSFNYYEHEELPTKDPACYAAMASGRIMPDRIERARAHIIMAFGPYQVRVGDTIKVDMAEIFGAGIPGVKKNAQYLQLLKSKNFRVPSPPPRPHLRITTDNHEVTLDWTPQAGNVNPELYSDPNRGDTIVHPFEGYRLYKSTKGPDGPWTLLAEYDIVNDEGYNTGLQYSYKDAGLLNNIEYYYGLTAFSKSDRVINFPSQETSISSNAQTVVPGTAPPQTVGEVAAVPNPYRGDIAYSSYSPPWERPQGNRPWWMEQDRRIQFINLPAYCQIKIYTLSGDLVATINHADAAKGYEDWNLTSAIGQAVASGLYLFTVEDLNNAKVQVGKFVIIK